MDTFIYTLSIFIFLYWVLKGSELLIGFLFLIPQLKKDSKSALALEASPKVSLIFAACNEEKKLKETLSSMLAQNYPNFEVIAVNDRSTDRTLEIMKEFEGTPNFKMVNIEELPDGWLGKTHALYQGYLVSSGEWLLFTDADVFFESYALKSSMEAVENWKLDHLTMFPNSVIKKIIEGVFIRYFITAFCLRYRPWAARFSMSRAYAGVGAFNLIRRSTYETIGTHKKVALSIDDDLKLGKFIKRNGFRQMLAQGKELVSVQWVSGWRGVMQSLQKNGFTGFGYNMRYLVLGSMLILAFDVAPFVFIFCVRPPTLYFLAGSIFMIFLIYLLWQKFYRKSIWLFPVHPLGALVCLLVLWHSAFSALIRGGVTWRGTFYPLKSLRAFQKGVRS